MRPLEGLIAILVVAYYLWPRVTRSQPLWRSFLPLAALITTGLHVFLEGQRWQMWPLYALVVFAMWQSLKLWRRRRAGGSTALVEQPGRRGWPQVRAWLGTLFILLLAIALPVLLPVPRLPDPTGPYPVGTTTLHLVDPSREELYSAEANAPRELMVQIWYPAQPDTGAKAAPWLPGVEKIVPALARSIGFPSFFVNHIHLARSHSFQEAEVSDDQDRYPVLLFSHGWGGLRVQNTFQMEELASHGYVVAAADHTYGSAATVFPDGRVVLENPQALPTNEPLDRLASAGNRLVSQWAGDMGFVLDELGRMNADEAGGRFTGKLNVDQVGVLGHSTGGGAAIEFCARDRRCAAGLPMDAYMTPVSKSVLESGLSQPFLFMFSELWPSERNDLLFSQLYRNMSGPAFHIVVAGADHFDFTDIPLISPAAAMLGVKGPLPARRGQRLINDFTLAFFDHYLLQQEQDAFGDLLERYPEASFNAFP